MNHPVSVIPFLAKYQVCCGNLPNKIMQNYGNSVPYTKDADGNVRN